MVLALAGTGGGITVIIKALIDKSTGKTERVRVANADMKTQRDDAYLLADTERDRATAEQKRADRESRNRNRWADYAAVLVRLLIQAGILQSDIPTPPRNEEAP
jgi:hypothetical protein